MDVAEISEPVRTVCTEGVLLGEEIHVIGLRTRHVTNLADVRLRIDKQLADHASHVFDCDRRSRRRTLSFLWW